MIKKSTLLSSVWVFSLKSFGNILCSRKPARKRHTNSWTHYEIIEWQFHMLYYHSNFCPTSFCLQKAGVLLNEVKRSPSLFPTITYLYSSPCETFSSQNHFSSFKLSSLLISATSINWGLLQTPSNRLLLTHGLPPTNRVPSLMFSWIIHKEGSTFQHTVCLGQFPLCSIFQS